MAPATDDAASSGAAAATAAAAVAAPLNAAATVGATLKKDVHTVEWNGQVSANSFHIFVNETGEELDLSWGDELRDNPHSTVAPHANAHVGTYDFHTWRVRSKDRGLIATYTGPSVILTVTGDGHKLQLNPTGQRPHPQPAGAGARQAGRAGAGAAGAAAAAASAAGSSGGGGGGGGAEQSEPGYRQRSSVLGMPIWAFDGVSDAAVARLAQVVGCMLAHSPAPLVERLVAGGASFAVFGTEQVVTDVPAHRFMRYNTGRDLDTSARGLGATPTVPVTSCGEENLTMEGDRWYPCQSILIHEVGHMVHNMGLPPGPDGVEGVLEAYRAAMKSKLYPKGCYMATNEQEYWAVAVESWFESTIRTDVNGGVKTRAALKQHDPRLAALLESAFGDGDWRYWKDCPRALAMPSRAPAAPAAAAARPAAAGAAAAGGAAVAPVPPSWRSRRPAKLLVDSLLDDSDSAAADESPARLLFPSRSAAAAAAACLRSLGLGGASAATASQVMCACWLPVPPPPTAAAAAADGGPGGAAADGLLGARLLLGVSWLCGSCWPGTVPWRGKASHARE